METPGSIADLLLRSIEPALIDLGADAFDSVPRIVTPRGSGSGVVWSAEGLIVTNRHVVATGPVRVATPDGASHEAQIIAQDAGRDLALLKVNGESVLRPIRRGAPPVTTGRLVVAVGNPLGLQRVLTLGIVVAGNAQAAPGDDDQPALIQTDVTLAPGNSGGALLDSNGRLIGINTLVMGSASFAIPISAVESFVASSLATQPSGSREHPPSSAGYV